MSKEEKAKKELEHLIRSRYSLIYIVSHEESRIVDIVNSIAAKLQMNHFYWTNSQGFKSDTVSMGLINEDSERNLKDARSMLDWIGKNRGLQKNIDSSEIYSLLDFHPFIDEIGVKRLLRDISARFRTENRTIIFISPVLSLPVELEKEVTVIDWPLPDKVILEEIFQQVFLPVEERCASIKTHRPLYPKMIEAALGLTSNEAENVFVKTTVQLTEDNELNPIESILGEKKQIIRKSGFLEFFESDVTIEDVGGMNVLKRWLSQRYKAISKEARLFGIFEPKGILLIGPSGVGKSLVVKTVGNLWKIPILRLDVGRVMSSFVGESESNILTVQKIAESVAPCVLWMDEVEKGFAGSQSSSQCDAGTMAKVFGSFITWTQERKSLVFLAATANNIQNLPPEFLRKGRFDEIFAIDLPNLEERIAILEIKIKKSGRDPQKFNCKQLAETIEGFSGAEIEGGLNSALLQAFDEGRELMADDIADEFRQITPLSVVMEPEIKAIRSWIVGRGKLASEPEKKNEEADTTTRQRHEPMLIKPR